MRNNLFTMLAFIAYLAATGCGAPLRCDVQFTMDEPFTLHQGATACSADRLTLRFDSVAGDSRCPVGVNCIWAGRVDAVVTLALGDKTQTLTLASGDMRQGGASEASFEGYTVRLEDAEPPKTEGKNIAQQEYRLKLRVRK